MSIGMKARHENASGVCSRRTWLCRACHCYSLLPARRMEEEGRFLRPRATRIVFLEARNDVWYKGNKITGLTLHADFLLVAIPAKATSIASWLFESNQLMICIVSLKQINQPLTCYYTLFQCPGLFVGLGCQSLSISKVRITASYGKGRWRGGSHA